MTDTAHRPPLASLLGRGTLRRDDRDEDPDIPSRLLVIVAAAPVAIAALAMRPLIQGIAWWLSGLAIAAVLVAVMLAVRQRRRGMRFAVLVAAVIATACAAALLNDIQPLGWLDRHGALGEMVASVRLNPAPLPQTDAVRLLVTVGIAWAVGLSLFLAAVAPTAALSAVPALLILVVPGIITGTPASAVLVVLTAVAFLMLLWLSVRPTQHALPAVVVAAIAVVVAVGLPSVVPLNAGWLSGVTGAIQAPVAPGRPGTLLQLGDDLRRPTQVEVFRYRTSTGSPEYLKLANLDEFGTGDWVPTVTDAAQASDAGESQIAVGVNPRLAQRGDAQIRITGLSSQYLPVPSGAVIVQSQSTALDLADWRWMGDSSTIRSTGPATRRGDLYQVYGAATFANPYLDAVSARGGFGLLDDGDWTAPTRAELRTDLDLPSDLPASIRSTAYRVAGSADNAYERGRALEDWFRSSRFTYSETAPVEQGYDGDSMDVIATFLRVREGYCVHFASAMAVMARTLGIPSRIAVGYRPGGVSEDGEYAVSNRQLHSWPELYIQGAGWVAFDPTPASETGTTPQQTESAAPSSVATPTSLPSEPAPQPSGTTPSATSTASAQPGHAAGTSTGGTGGLGVGLGVLVALAVLLAPGVVRLLRRRARFARIGAGRQPALHAWHEALDDIADHGYAPGLAPPGDAAATARTARATLGRLRGTLPDAVLPALGTIVDALDRERYARDGSAVPAPVLLGAVREVREALDASVTAGRRVRSRIWPASLLPSSAWSATPRRPRRV